MCFHGCLTVDVRVLYCRCSILFVCPASTFDQILSSKKNGLPGKIKVIQLYEQNTAEADVWSNEVMFIKNTQVLT